MSGRPNDKWLATMIEKHGSREAVTKHQQEVGRKGGQNGRSGGFASTTVGKDGLTGRQRASLVGVKGGMKSKRKPAKSSKIGVKEITPPVWQDLNLIDTPSTLSTTSPTFPCASCGKESSELDDMGLCPNCPYVPAVTKRRFNFWRPF